MKFLVLYSFRISEVVSLRKQNWKHKSINWIYEFVSCKIRYIWSSLKIKILGLNIKINIYDCSLKIKIRK